MLAINSHGALIDNSYEKQRFLLKKYTINTLVLLWKLFFNMLALMFRVLQITLKILSCIFLGITAFFLLLSVARRR